MVIMATRSLDVEARSDALFQLRIARYVDDVQILSDLSSMFLERRKLLKCCLDIVFGKFLRLR